MVANISDSEALNLMQAAVEQAWMALRADWRTVTPALLDALAIPSHNEEELEII
jgi:hypothetical protein